MTRVDSIKGTRDFFPDDMRVRSWIENRWREVALRFAFEEYDAPALEPLDLYTRKSGAEIVDQLYAFEDKGGRQVALRPEMTPSLARMVAARSQGLPKPIKWFSIPRLFRYERPQRGRFREFWQLNLDILGVEGIEADAEIIAAGVAVLEACGLTQEDFVLRYNDRRLLDRVVAAFGVSVELRPAAYAALDRLLRVGPEAVVEALVKAGVERPRAVALTEAVGRRDLAGLEDAAAREGADLSSEVEILRRLESYLEAYGVAGACTFDAAIVRGLAYYTGVVFEMYDRAGDLRALCGGGRFDDLLEAAGGEPLPAVGFGLGEAVLVELLTERERLPVGGPRCDAYVIPVTPADRPAAIRVASELRAAGLETDLMLKDQSIGKGLKRAGQAGARVAVLIGERERDSGRLQVKDLASGEQATVPLEALVARLAGDAA